MVHQESIKKLHNGLMGAPAELAGVLMPELDHIIGNAPVPNLEDYTADVKVHMLMPGQYPCIPGWHRDMVPRDSDLTLRPDLVDTRNRMWIWLSHAPTTEFHDGEDTMSIPPGVWWPFTQADWHRGTPADEHGWRVFIRLAPRNLKEPQRKLHDMWRRHSQVYLDASNFQW